jgi:hypothetical protein
MKRQAGEEIKRVGQEKEEADETYKEERKKGREWEGGVQKGEESDALEIIGQRRPPPPLRRKE